MAGVVQSWLTLQWLQDGQRGGIATTDCTGLTLKNAVLVYPTAQFQHTQGTVMEINDSSTPSTVLIQVSSLSMSNQIVAPLPIFAT